MALSDIHRGGQGSEWRVGLVVVSRHGIHGSVTEGHFNHDTEALSRQWASLLIVARQVSCHPAETTGVVLQWHEKSPWSREERSITNAELELAFCIFVQGKRLANLIVLGVSPARREWHGDRLNCPCSLWLLLHYTHAGLWACPLASTWTKFPATRWLPG